MYDSNENLIVYFDIFSFKYLKTVNFYDLEISKINFLKRLLFIIVIERFSHELISYRRKEILILIL